jgi:hypothetical protein
MVEEERYQEAMQLSLEPDSINKTKTNGMFFMEDMIFLP